CIGAAISLALAKQGWNIAIHYHHSQKEAAFLAEQCRTYEVKAYPFQANLADKTQIEFLIKTIQAQLGNVTCLINNAAYFVNDDITTFTCENWEAHFNVNLYAPCLLSQQFAKLLPHEQAGNIINILDYCVFSLPDRFLSYTLSKSALWSMTQMAARMLAPAIRVNAIAPGPTLRHPRQSEKIFATSFQQSPLGRCTTPDDIAQATLYLLNAPAVTGQCLVLDGGKHLMQAPYC
ncbi:MAG: SDR family oxidoreductase, partial [Burkholderiales bacterium]